LWPAAQPLHAETIKEREQALSKQYAGRTLFLRRFYTSGSQRFDKNGNVVGKAPATGSWTLYGMIQVEKIVLKERSVQVVGKRLQQTFQQDQAVISLGSIIGVKLEIELTEATLELVADAIKKVTIENSMTALAEVTPPCWSSYLRKDANEKQSDIARALERSHSDRPKILKEPKPEYTPDARTAKLTGQLVFSVVLKQDGAVDQVRIVKPLGMGLDDATCEKALEWRFEPLKGDGNATPPTVFIVLNFAFSRRRRVELIGNIPDFPLPPDPVVTRVR
jgi:TonB family protein